MGGGRASKARYLPGSTTGLEVLGKPYQAELMLADGQLTIKNLLCFSLISCYAVIFLTHCHILL